MVKVERSLSTWRPEVDQSFVDTVKTTLKEFPLGVLYLLSSKGCKVKIAPTIVDDDMRLQHRHPGGYESDSDFKCPVTEARLRAESPQPEPLMSPLISIEPCKLARRLLGSSFWDFTAICPVEPIVSPLALFKSELNPESPAETVLPGV